MPVRRQGQPRTNIRTCGQIRESELVNRRLKASLLPLHDHHIACLPRDREEKRKVVVQMLDLGHQSNPGAGALNSGLLRRPVGAPRNDGADSIRTEHALIISRLRRAMLLPVVARKQQQQRNDPADGKARAVIEDGCVAYSVPQQAGDDAGDKLQQAHRRIVPADPAGAQALRHQVRSERLADGTKYPLVQSVENKQPRNQGDVLRQRKTEIGDEEDDELRQQDAFASPFVGQRPRRIGNQRGYQVERRVDQDCLFQRPANVLGAQNEERVARIAEAEQSGD